MRDRITAALKGSKADYTELRIEEREASNVVYRGKHLETADAVIDTGGIVRCLCRNHGWGMATFNSLDDLPARVEHAYQCARAAQSKEPIELAPVPPQQAHIRVSLGATDGATLGATDGATLGATDGATLGATDGATPERDFRGVSLAEKKALAEGYNRIMLGFSDKIVDTTTVYRDSFTHLFFASSEGTFIEEERPAVAVACFAVARDGDNVQTAHKTRASQRGLETALGCEDLALGAARLAVDLLSAESVVGGRYPVVINPQLAGVFVHEAFGHLSESDFVYENPKAREMMVLGRRFGANILTVFDDGSLPGLRGTHRYDDEGTPTRRNDLIRNGILVGRLHSRETAAKMGEAVTGNARAVSYRHPPIVRMTNTAIQAGTTPFGKMIGEIKLGIYACDAYGGETALENFSFSSGYAYMIRDGQVAEMVKDVILAGNLFTTLANIDAIGDDFEWSRGAGGCGKNDQVPLPVGMGAPHVRIQDVAIGGR